MATFKPNHLLIDELNYELKIRGIVTDRNMNEKRSILAKAMQKGKNPTPLVDPEFKFDDEKVEIEATLKNIENTIPDFESGSTKDSVYQRLRSRLCHVGERIKRMEIDQADRAQVIFKNEAYATTVLLESTLEDKISKTESTPIISDDLSNSLMGMFSQYNPSRASPSVSNSKPPAIYKWNVKFDGTKKTLGVKSFLERVRELAEARQVSKTQLFDAALDLFEGKALLWLRRIKDSVRDWDSLCNRLEEDFLEKDYDEELWNLIKHRKQVKDESIE